MRAARGVLIMGAAVTSLAAAPALVRSVTPASCLLYSALEPCSMSCSPDDTKSRSGYHWVRRTCGGLLAVDSSCGCSTDEGVAAYCGAGGCTDAPTYCAGVAPAPEVPSCGGVSDACTVDDSQSCEPEPEKVPQFAQRPDEGGAATCTAGTDLDKAGDDPISLPARAAVTEPFADFASEGVVKLALSRTYSSADVSIRAGAAPGVFGPGWRHDWEAELTCQAIGSARTCRVSVGLAAGMSFYASPPSSVAGAGTSSNETWTVYPRIDRNETGTGDRSVLVQRRVIDASGASRELGWIAFLADGRELHFATVCDSCAPATDLYCKDPLAGGRARLVKVVYRTGNAVQVAYDRPAGVLLSLTDPVTGHTLALKQPGSACTLSRAQTLEYDGVVYASYEYLGAQLSRVHLGGLTGTVLRAYEYDPRRPAYLAAVRNAAGDPIVEFGYDASGWATHVADRASTVDVSYVSSAVTQVTTARGATSRTRKRSGGGTAVFYGGDSYLLSDRYLRCREDAASRIHWYDRDELGRITRHAEYAPGTVACSTADSAAPAVVPLREETFEYGLVKPVAPGISIDLPVVTKVHRTSVLAGQAPGAATPPTFDVIYDHRGEYAAWDPSGYACTVAPLPVGSVPCRYIEDGLTKDVTGSILREQRATFFSYDARGRLVKTIGPMRIGQASDPGIPIEERSYWPDVGEAPARRGRLREVRRYPGAGAPALVTTFDWDTFGPFQVVDPNGRITLLVRDSRGRIAARVTPDARSMSVRYHDELSPRLVLFGDGTSVRYQYDQRGRVSAVQPLPGDPESTPGLAAGWTALSTYDPEGNSLIVSIADANGIVRWLRLQRFGADHRLVSEFHPEGAGVASWGYDPSGVVTSFTDEESRTTRIELDGLGRPQVIRRTRPGPLGTASVDVAAYTFEPAGEGLHSVTDGRGTVTAYEHDDFGGVLSVANATTFKTGPWRYAYDARGAVSQRSNGTTSTSYAYDGLGRLTQLTATNRADGEWLQYTYVHDRAGQRGRLASIVEARRRTEFVYDEVGRLLSETVRETGVTAPLTTAYGWDAAGYLSTLTYASGLQVRYERDPATKTLTAVRNPRSGTTYASQVSYWPRGPLRHVRFGNGKELATSYDLRYRPRTISTGPVSLAYEPTPAGNIGAVTEGATRSSYGFDLLDRLVAFSPGRTSDARALRYAYAGDRLVAAYPFGGDVPVYAFGYDDQANLSAVSVYDSAGTAITKTLCLKHDALGRLVLVGLASPASGGPDRLACRSVSDVTQVIARFEYDARNRRVARTTASTGSTTEFVFLPDGRHAAELSRPAAASGAWSPLRDYVWLEDTPLAQVERTVDGQDGRPYYFHVDHLGLPRALTDPAGLVAWSAEARPYGDVVERAGATVVTNLRLPGQYDERLFAAAGIGGMQGPYYNWNRWYLPSMGRYLELDPIAVHGGFNSQFRPDWYNYVGGNPLRFADPAGLCRVDVRFKYLGTDPLGDPYYHAYIVNTDVDGRRYFFRGGPSFPVRDRSPAVCAGLKGLASPGATASPFGYIDLKAGDYGPKTVDWETGSPPSMTVYEDGLPCNMINVAFSQTLSTIEHAMIPYFPFSTNSNAVVSQVLSSNGFAQGSPPVWAPGWNTQLLWVPDDWVQYPN